MRSTPSERQAHLQCWASSGMSRPAYCRENGLKYGTFMSWFKTQDRQDKEQDMTGHFVVLPTQVEHAPTEPMLEVYFPNGLKLQIHAQLTSSLLKMLSDVGK